MELSTGTVGRPEGVDLLLGAFATVPSVVDGLFIGADLVVDVVVAEDAVEKSLLNIV